MAERVAQAHAHTPDPLSLTPSLTSALSDSPKPKMQKNLGDPSFFDPPTRF